MTLIPGGNFVLLEAVRQAFGASWYSMDDGCVRASLGGIETLSDLNETVGFRCAKTLPVSVLGLAR